MKSLSSIFTFALVALLATTGFTTENPQDARTEAIMAFNNARELADGGEYVDAIELYREALEIATSAECEECDEIVDRIENDIPRVYFSRASDAFQRFRSEQSAEAADAAVEFFREAQDAGEEFGNNEIRDRSRGVIPQIYYNKSLIQFRQEDYGSAIESLDRAIELNENYTLAHYQKAIVMNNQGSSLEEVLAQFDRAIEVGERVGDSENVARSQRRASGELIYHATQRMDEERYADALRMLERAEAYTPTNADLHYRYAEVFNNRGNYGRAIEHANRALELESGGVVDRAKIYYELGLAYKGQENVDQACNAFENAAYGDFRDPALHEMEYELECEGYAAAGNR